MTSTYLDIGCVRIQSWISRWPDLRGRRGASAALTLATNNEAINRYLTQGGWPDVRINQDVPDVDGVISLVIGDQTTPEAVTSVVLAQLRGNVPGAEFQVVWGQGEDYFEAYRTEMAPRIEAGDVTLALSPPNELPIIARCDLTGTDPAVTQVKVPESRRAGRDAANRARLAGHRTDQRARGGTALDTEQELAIDLDRGEVDDFDGLARLGPTERKQNHLATIYLDGNRIGDRFADLRPRGDDESTILRQKSAARAQLGKDLHHATREALWGASRRLVELTDDARFLPVIPHIVGGDDVLVSVPAAFGIVFARTFMTRFTGEMNASDSLNTITELVGEPGNVSFTASAGLVIAHASYPFGPAVDVAAELLKRAKTANLGTRATVLVAELTTDDTNLPGAAESWTLDQLIQFDQDLIWLAGLGQSYRTQLLGAASHPDVRLARAYVAQLLRRSGHLGELSTELEDDPKRLVQALELTRWWI